MLDEGCGFDLKGCTRMRGLVSEAWKNAHARWVENSKFVRNLEKGQRLRFGYHSKPTQGMSTARVLTYKHSNLAMLMGDEAARPLKKLL